MSTGALQWVVSAYVLGYGGFVLLGGRAADLLGRRRMFLFWLGVFLVFSGLGGLATEGWMLIARPLRHGRRRRLPRARRPVDHHDDVRRGPGAQQGAARLRRHRGGRLLARPGRRRPADGDRLALGVLRARCSCRRRSSLAAVRLIPDDGRPDRGGAGFDLPGAAHRDGRDAAARLRRRPGAGPALGGTLLALAGSAGAARRLRRRRAALGGAAAAPRAAPLGAARARQRRHDAVRRRVRRASSSSPCSTCRSCAAGRRSRPASRCCGRDRRGARADLTPRLVAASAPSP